MRKISLAGERSFENEDKHIIHLSYYLVKDYRDTAVETPLYGIQILKQMKVKGRVLKEKETAVAISYSESFVRQILYDLINNMITPVCLLEIVDDLVTKDMYYSA